MFLAKSCSQFINKQIQANKKFVSSALLILLKSDTNLISIWRNQSKKGAGEEYFASLIASLNPKSSITPESTADQFITEIEKSAPEPVGNNHSTKNKENLQSQNNNNVENKATNKLANTTKQSRSRIVKSVPEPLVNDYSTKEDVNLQLQTNNIVKNKATVIFSEHYDEPEPVNKKLRSYISAANSDSEFANEEDIDDTIHFDKGENILSVDEVAPSLPVGFNFAPYIEKSETLREFVKLGVDLNRFKDDPKVAEFILRLDFKKDVQPHIQFLSDKGVPPNKLGRFITRNPLIFRHSLENLQIRINYLESKKFDSDAIAKIIIRSPKYLNYSTVEIDRQLGYIQKTFSLSGDEVRSVVTNQPKLFFWKLSKLQEMDLCMKEEFGFSFEESRSIFLKQPKVWLVGKHGVRERFNLVHKEMEMNNDIISKNPEVLLHKASRTKQRHLFLKSLNLAQYNPSVENFISLRSLVILSDSEFCKIIAKTSVQKFHEFLKTLENT